VWTGGECKRGELTGWGAPSQIPGSALKY